MQPDLPSPDPSQDDFNPFAGGEIARVVPTTEPQREIWLAAKMQPEASLSYNESVTLRLRGPLDRAAMQAALGDLLARHDALRATVSPDGMQLLLASGADIALELLDLDGRAPAEHERALADARRRHVLEPFDLEHGPLLRAELLRFSDSDHALLLSAHHIVCDGWSFGVLVQDLGALYSARRAAAATPARASALAFGDYALERAEFTASEDYRALERYWLSQVGEHAAPLELPTDHERSAPRSYRSEREDSVVAPALLDSVRKAGASSGASLFVTLLGAFAVLMHRLSGQRDFIVGVPAAGQNTEGREHLIGHAVHLLPLRIEVDPAESFRSLLGRLRTSMLDAFEHQGYTFGSLLRKLVVERDASRPTLVSVMFNVDQLLQLDGAFAGLEAEFRSNPRAFENFDVSVNVVQEHGGLRAECQYGSELFEGATIRSWLDSYRAILQGVVDDAGRAIGQLELVSPADREAWARLNATAAPLRRDEGVWHRFAAQAASMPDRVAVTDAAGSLSYAQLEVAASRLAASLSARGAGPGERVGLALERNTGMLVAVLATLRTGAAYVPLDPAFPEDRLAFMAEDARLRLIVTQAAVSGPWQAAGVPLLLIDAAGLPSEPEAPGAPLVAPVHGDAPAYVIYTSGSTGKPKGVCVPHRAVVNFLDSMALEPGLGADDRLLAVTTLSFDIAVLELLLPLTRGARVVLATRDEAMDGQSLRELVERHGITVLQATPSTWRLLLESGWPGARTLKALSGGEPLPADLASELVFRVGSVWNMYGPTETTVWSTLHAVRGDEITVPIGHPIANTQVYVLDERRQPCPVGVRGEIWIGGEGVTLGYWERPELTADRFIPDPFAGHGRLYRTGDLGRLRYDGVLECSGRTDFQVKVRGHRIELGEIESVLAAHPAVARCVVDARAMPSGDRALCAYVIWQDDPNRDGQVLREHLRRHLPEYMVPSAYVALDAIPLTPNGKIDRRALPDPGASALRSSSSAYQPAQSPTEQRLAAIWSELLCTPQVGRHDNFFDLGGHSLLAMRAIAMMERDTGRRVRPASYVLETLSQIASHYDASTRAVSLRRRSPPAAALFGKLMASIRRKP